jgi:hypothetical protein
VILANLHELEKGETFSHELCPYMVTVFASLTLKLVATVSFGLVLKPMVDFLVEPQNQGGGGFFGLGLKISSSGLVI